MLENPSMEEVEMDWTGKQVAVSGKFRHWAAADIEVLLRARGVSNVLSSPSKRSAALVSAESEGKKVDAARALGQPVIVEDALRAALGEPLADYRERLLAYLAQRPSYYQTVVQAVGEPASAATLERIEARIGFGLPTAARHLWEAMNGLCWLWVHGDHAQGLTLSTKRIPWTTTAADDESFWGPMRHGELGLVNIPDAETIFLNEWLEPYRNAP
jgi:hypothetical protein